MNYSSHKCIKKARMICGLLEELSITKSLFSVKASKDGNILSTLIMDFLLNADFDKSKILFKYDFVEGKTYYFESLTAGLRVSFEAIASPEGITLPHEVLLSDFRKNKRISLSAQAYVAEIRFKKDIVFGFVSDISSDAISILTDIDLNERKNLNVEILISRKGDKNDLIFRTSLLIYSERVGENFKNVFIVLNRNNLGSKIDRPKRHNVKGGISISFQSATIGDSSYEGEINIFELSLTGFLGEIHFFKGDNSLPMGSRLECFSPNISFYVIRKMGNTFAFKIASFLDDLILSEWTRFIRRNTLEALSQIAPNDTMAKFLTGSTLLKSERRKMYGKNVSPFLSQFNNEKVGDIHYRFTLFSSAGEASINTSITKISDHSWVLHEVMKDADLEEADVPEFHNSILEHLGELSRFVPTSPKHCLIIFNPLIPAIGGYWLKRAQENYCRVYSAYLMSLKDYKTNHTGNVVGSICEEDIFSLSAQARHTLASFFNLELLDLFDFWGGNPNLQRQLSMIGEGHKINQKLLTYNGKKLAVIYKFHSYFSLNVTGVINTLFVLFPRNVDSEDILLTIDQINQSELMSVKDLLLFFENEEDRLKMKNYGENLKLFNLLDINLAEKK